MSNNFSKKKKEEVRKKFKGRCAYCGVKLTVMHIDHIIPLQRGYTREEADKYGIAKGTNDISNLNPSCPSCNISKGTFTIDQWRQELILKVDRLRRDSTNFRLVERYGIVKKVNKDVVFYFEKKGGYRG